MDINLTNEDKSLIVEVVNYINLYYEKNRHHVACILVTKSGKKYIALHLDSTGIDICCEPIAISNAICNNDIDFATIVAAQKYDNNNVSIVNPCGNCRQILSQYCPDINIIINDNGICKKAKIAELLPYPY